MITAGSYVQRGPGGSAVRFWQSKKVKSHYYVLVIGAEGQQDNKARKSKKSRWASCPIPCDPMVLLCQLPNLLLSTLLVPTLSILLNLFVATRAFLGLLLVGELRQAGLIHHE